MNVIEMTLSHDEIASIIRALEHAANCKDIDAERREAARWQTLAENLKSLHQQVSTYSIRGKVP
jgi:hypothetical protein